MADLTFINSLNDEQSEYALKVAQKAEKMGIPKTLALGIVMNESGFNPKVPDSKAGAIGLMQVMPKTGKALGYTVDQLRNEDSNIEAGLKALKENLDRTKGDWLLSAALYNAGDRSLSNTNVAQKGIPAETKDYVQKLQSYGVFNTADERGAEASVPDEEAAAPPAVDDFPSDMYQKIAEAQNRNAGDQQIITEAQDRAKAQLGGAAAGTAISVARAAPAAVKASARMLEEGRIAAQEAAAARAAQASAQAAGGSGTTGRVSGNAGPLSSVGVRPSPPGSVIPDAGYLAKGETGVQVYNTAKGLGFTDVQAADFVKKGMTAKDVYAEAQNTRSAGFKKTRDLFPDSGNWVENPQHAGLSLPEESGGKGPRESFKIVPGASGQPSTLQSLPVSAPISTAPPKPSGLEYVRDLFTGLMDSKVGKGVGTFMRYAGPPAAIADIASEGVNLYQQGQKPDEQRDYGDMALSGLGILAGGASLAASPLVAVPAGLTAAGIGGYRYLRDRAAAEQARQRMSGQPMR